MSRRAAALAVLGLLAAPGTAAACRAKAPPDPSVPTWRAVNAFTLGARPATDAEIERYLAAVDRASTRVRTILAGRSVEGRPLTLAVVGRPATIADGALSVRAARMRALRAGTATSKPAAERLAARDPAFAWIGGPQHGNEPSGADADMQLVYDLAAGRDCATELVLRRLVSFVLPLQNPDGRAAGRRTNAAGFDLNRDWFARTQPETEAKLTQLLRYPPLLFVDQHEEGGESFFVPPNADPVHHEVSRQALDAIGKVLTPPVRRAFAAHGYTVTSDATYDLFFMGYGDTAPATLLGAAGMTFEKGGASPFPQKVAEHLLAARTVLDAAAAHKAPLLRAWAAQWREARRQGARGERQPNRLLHPGRAISTPVPRTPVYGYAFRPDVHRADAIRLVERLTSAGVEAYRLVHDAPVARFRPFGERGAAGTVLPAGTYWVPLAQGAKHWVEALLADESYSPFPYFYDVSAWSNPLLMGLAGGALESRLPAGSELVGARSDGVEPSPAAGGPAYVFASGAMGSAELAVALLRDGAVVRRVPGSGAFATTAEPRDEAARRGIVLARAEALPEGAVALRAPKVALLADPEGNTSLSPAWAAHVLGGRLGLAPDRLGTGDLAAGRLTTGGYDAFVVPDGTVEHGGLSAAALAALAAWVRTGGTLVAWRGQGADVAQAAGVTAVRASAPQGLLVPGASLRVVLDPADPVAWGEETRGFTFDVDDPVLAAGGAPVVARYPAGGGFWASGSTSGTAALQGTPAATDERVGTGRVVLFAFDPCFRGYAEGTMRLLANALLIPPPTS
jgi:hypothetical protein